MSGFSTQAVLLRKIEYADHDFIITFLTRSNGKISVIAKNAKKSVQRFSGALDLFSRYHIQCVFPKKNKDGLIILSQAELENGFVHIREDVFKTAYASFWAELVHFWVEEEKPMPSLYDLLVFSLDALDQDRLSQAVTSLFFLIRFMNLSGLSPDFETCRGCGQRVDDMDSRQVWFDFKEGRLFCRNCRNTISRYGLPVSKGTLKQLDWINTTQTDRVERIRFSEFAIKEGQALLEAFIPFHMGREFKSLYFLRQLRLDK